MAVTSRLVVNVHFVYSCLLGITPVRNYSRRTKLYLRVKQCLPSNISNVANHKKSQMQSVSIIFKCVIRASFCVYYVFFLFYLFLLLEFWRRLFLCFVLFGVSSYIFNFDNFFVISSFSEVLNPCWATHKLIEFLQSKLTRNRKQDQRPNWYQPL